MSKNQEQFISDISNKDKPFILKIKSLSHLATMMRKTLCRDRSKKTSFQIFFLSFVTLSLLYSFVLILKMWYYPLNYSTLYVNSNLSFNNAHLLQTNLKLQAVQASPNSYRFLQPDGITLTPPLYPHGCHSYHFTTDYLGYTVMDNNETGWKVYGTRNKTSGKLEPTKLKVGLGEVMSYEVPSLIYYIIGNTIQ